MLEIGDELDKRIESLKNTTGIIIDCVPEILSTHKFLMDTFTELTGLEKYHWHQSIYIFIVRISFSYMTVGLRQQLESLLRGLRRNSCQGLKTMMLSMAILCAGCLNFRNT